MTVIVDQFFSVAPPLVATRPPMTATGDAFEVFLDTASGQARSALQITTPTPAADSAATPPPSTQGPVALPDAPEISHGLLPFEEPAEQESLLAAVPGSPRHHWDDLPMQEPVAETSGESGEAETEPLPTSAALPVSLLVIAKGGQETRSSSEPDPDTFGRSLPFTDQAGFGLLASADQPSEMMPAPGGEAASDVAATADPAIPGGGATTPHSNAGSVAAPVPPEALPSLPSRSGPPASTRSAATNGETGPTTTQAQAQADAPKPAVSAPGNDADTAAATAIAFPPSGTAALEPHQASRTAPAQKATEHSAAGRVNLDLGQDVLIPAPARGPAPATAHAEAKATFEVNGAPARAPFLAPLGDRVQATAMPSPLITQPPRPAGDVDQADFSDEPKSLAKDVGPADRAANPPDKVVLRAASAGNEDAPAIVTQPAESRIWSRRPLSADENKEEENFQAVVPDSGASVSREASASSSAPVQPAAPLSPAFRPEPAIMPGSGLREPTLPAMAHRQIADAIVRTRDGTVEVRLSPHELGRVTLTIGAEGAHHVAIVAERPETLDLLRRHADQLTRDLRDGGWSEPQLDFLQDGGRSGGNEQQPQPERRHRLRHDPATEPDRGTPAAPLSRPAAAGSGRLDIRM